MRQQTRPLKEPAEKVVQDIRRATRKHYSAEEKIRIVLEGLRGEDSIAEPSGGHGAPSWGQQLSLPVRPAFQVVALGDQHDTLRKCGRWMNAPRRASSMGSPVPQRFHPKNNQYASREYESWQQLE